MKTFREFMGESNNTNWSEVEGRRKKYRDARSAWKSNKEINAEAGKYGVRPSQIQTAIRNRKKQRPSTKPVTLPTLPPSRSE